MNTKRSKKSITKIKTKTLPTAFEDFDQPKLAKCPQCSSSKLIIKVGKRKVQNELIQDYLCKNCNKKFVDRTLKQSSNPTSIILHALTYFNLGHTLAQTQATMKRKYNSKKFHQQQIYDFKYHTLKTNFSKRFFPQLKTYIKSIHQVPYFIPDSVFKSGPRCSQLRIDINAQKTTKDNNAPRLAELALTLAKTNRERH